MTNYQNDILEMLQGETPRQKYDFLVEILKMHREHDSEVESTLLTICDKLNKDKMTYIKWRENVQSKR